MFKCKWEIQDKNQWFLSCTKKFFMFSSGNPYKHELTMRFCPYCGKKIKEFNP